MALSLHVLNVSEATFDCTFGRGCEGICCKNGRPSVDRKDIANIRKVLKRALPLMRPKARKLVEDQGFTSRRIKIGLPMLRVVDGWCVFFNQGCVLHQIGVEDGESYRYKPVQCALFPIEQDEKSRWFIRQWGYKQEDWMLPCLNPKASKIPAAKSLKAELELAAKLDGH